VGELRHTPKPPPLLPSRATRRQPAQICLQNTCMMKGMEGKIVILQPRPTCQSSKTELISRTAPRMVWVSKILSDGLDVHYNFLVAWVSDASF
jgi:hypothetical protein